MTLDTNAHVAILRVSTFSKSEQWDYIKKHVSDANAWHAFYSLSNKDDINSLIKESFKILPRNIVLECACRFAEYVLSTYETKYNDTRPRDSIDLARKSITDKSITKQQLLDAAYAAYSAAGAAAYAANAAANAANAAANAAYAAADAANAAYAADAAANAAANAANAARQTERLKQLDIIIEVIRESTKEIK